MPAYPNRPFSDSCVSRDVSRNIARESNSYMSVSRQLRKCTVHLQASRFSYAGVVDTIRNLNSKATRPQRILTSTLQLKSTPLPRRV